MNLRTFHLVFITCASALAFLFGAWVLRAGALEGPLRIVVALAAFALALGLVAYEAWFLRASRRYR